MFFVSLLASSLAHAEDESPKFPVITPSGVLFAHYSMSLTDGARNYNEFGIDRVYVRADAQMSPIFGARVTLDADHMKPLVESDGSSVSYDTKYRVFVKHAYLEAKDLGPIKIRAGIVDTPWGPYYDAFWGNRFISDSFAKNAGLIKTADNGVSILGKHNKGLVDWNLSAFNGEGYDSPEVDSGKTLQARLSVDPLAPAGDKDRQLPISGFASYGMHPTTGDDTMQWAGAAGFSIPRLCLWAEADGTTTGKVSGFGYSVSAEPRLPKYGGLVIRYDSFDADTSSKKDSSNMLIAGLEHHFLDKVAVAVTYERSWNDALPDAPAHGVAVRMLAGF